MKFLGGVSIGEFPLSRPLAQRRRSLYGTRVHVDADRLTRNQADKLGPVRPSASIFLSAFMPVRLSAVSYLSALMLASLSALLAVPTTAQVPSQVPTPSVQNPGTMNPVTAPSLPSVPTPQLPGMMIPGPVAGQAAGLVAPPGLLPEATSGRIWSSVGRGLPGMPGGPPLTDRMGAEDPAARFMRPTVIGSLACDLGLDPECL